MFTLKIHTVDCPQPLRTTVATSSSAAHGPNPKSNGSPILSELRGITHIFRLLPNSTTIANPIARTTTVFIVAVPNYLSPDEFLLFCGPHLPDFSRVLFLRNDGMEHSYSVLVNLVSQVGADGFYCSFNGKRFKPAEAEVCHIYFLQSVEYTESADIASTPPYIASTPPVRYTELPTCPVCLERLDQDTSGIQSTLCDHSFQCSCVSKWTYLACQVCRLCQQQDERPSCSACGTLKNLCVCLICGFVGCGRYEKKHAIEHWKGADHHYSLELETQQIWDYVGDKYVHRLNHSKGDGKFIMVNSRCTEADGECTTCGCDEDSSLSGALFSSKVDTIVDEYNHLLASQLEIQRQHYESLLAEAKSGKESSISKAVEKAVFSKMNDLQPKIEMYTEETKSVAERNQVLLKNQELLQKKFRETEEREKLLWKSKDEKILDLKEQIRDLKVYVEAQRKLSNMTISGGKGGTLLPVESNQSSSNSRRRTKPGRRRN